MSFAKDFFNRLKSRALNAVGVMAKIDLNPEVMQRREEMAEKIAQQLQDDLNTVIPVSAGIHRVLTDLMENEISVPLPSGGEKYDAAQIDKLEGLEAVRLFHIRFRQSLRYL